MLGRLLLSAALILPLSGSLAANPPGASTETGALALAKRQAQQALQRSQQLERRAAEATDAAARARVEAAALAARVQASEADITAAETRIRIIEQLRERQTAQLAERQEPVIRLTAALQTMARRPAALALVQPGSVRDVVHVRSILASTLPVIRARTAALREEINESNRLRIHAQRAAAALQQSREELQKRRIELARHEERERARASSLADSAMSESDRALAFGEQARDLERLIGTRAFQARLRSDLAELPGPVLRPSSRGQTARRGNEAEPRKPRYQIPVDGTLVRGTGEISEGGVHARGLTFATDASTPVVAPAGGKIVYAGRFRGYGEIVVIDHGGGWSTTITRLAALQVRLGDRVSMGDPIGRTGRGQSQVGVELRRNGQPFPIAPLIAIG